MRLVRCWPTLVLLLAAPLWSEVLPPCSGDLGSHDPSTIFADGNRFWQVATGADVPLRWSDDLRRWTGAAPLFPVHPAWWSRFTEKPTDGPWAPDLVRLGDRIGLYYSLSRWGSNTSAIALASSPVIDPADPARAWRDDGIVFESGPGDDCNAIDPSVLVDGDRLWLAFGSFWSGIKLIELDPVSGKRKDPAAAPVALANTPSTEIEAPCLYRRSDKHQGDWYYLFVNWGRCCRGLESTYEIRMGRSRSATGPYLDRDGVDLRQGGGSVFIPQRRGRFIGPGHAGIVTALGRDWCSYHYYDGDHGGRATLQVDPLGWDETGWPVLEPTAAH